MSFWNLLILINISETCLISLFLFSLSSLVFNSQWHYSLMIFKNVFVTASCRLLRCQCQNRRRSEVLTHSRQRHKQGFTSQKLCLGSWLLVRDQKSFSQILVNVQILRFVCYMLCVSSVSFHIQTTILKNSY